MRKFLLASMLFCASSIASLFVNEFPQGVYVGYMFTVNFIEPGHFIITSTKDISGEGYCDEPTSCIYNFYKGDELRGAERLSFDHEGVLGSLVKIGNELVAPGHVVFWNDALQLVNKLK